MSEFIVSARKYRPQKFSDVVGQAHVSQTLKNALRSNHVAHAFLFCGPRGVGKTTNARILAKILNCTNRTPEFEACDACESCRAFNQNASFNIFELDAASNNSVEHIRGLTEQTRIPPQQGKYKVFIIDEVHMLSQTAFNAFLKTLEEPPPHAIFILATTEKHKIIPTILSRCQIFDFRRIQVPDIVAHLENICRQENLQADPDALHIIAQKADGALRDALSIFDRIVSASTNGHVTYNDVIENLNVLDYDYFFKVTDALLTEDVAGVLRLYDDIMRKGFEGDLFIEGLASHFRNLLVCKDIDTLVLLEAGEGLRSRYQQQATLAAMGFVLTALNLCNECDIHFKQARNKRLHVELYLIKMAHISRMIMGGGPIESPTLEKKNSIAEVVPTSTPSVAAPVKVSAVSSAPVKETMPTPEANTTEITIPETLSLPKIGTIDAILKDVEQEEAVLNQQVSILNMDNLTKFWSEYAENHLSPSTKTALQAAQYRIEGVQVLVSVGTDLAQGIIKDNLELPTFLRQKLHTPDLALLVSVDPALAPETSKIASKRVLTAHDKLIMMRNTNPLAVDLIVRLGLKPDE